MANIKETFRFGVSFRLVWTQPMTVSVKYTEMDLLEGFHCISFSTGSVQGNFLRYEFLKKKKFAASLQRHKATHSDTEKSFTCDVCDKKFTRLEYLHNHYHDTVLSPNEFQCPNCEKSFVFKSGEYRIHHCFHDSFSAQPLSCYGSLSTPA